MQTLKDLEIKRSYCSYGDDNITNSLLVPALKIASLYRRSVGFFSSTVFCSILDGVEGLVKNGGHIELIVSPKMSQDDVDAIQNGYKDRKDLVKERFIDEFNKALFEMSDSYFELTSELIKHSYLDIKVACTKEFGMYHDKLGIITDFNGNSIAFSGSANETYNGLSGHDNYEKVRVYKSWNEEQNEYLLDELDEFESLWNYKNNYVDTFDFTKFVRERVFEIIQNNERKKARDFFKLRDYQEKAIKNWVNNEYKGFFVMATGTGKTLTAIYSAKELFDKKEENIISVIVAPYKHLIKQWAEDIKTHLRPDILIQVSSENPSWADEIVRANLELKINKNKRIEKANKIMMPILFGLFIVLAIYIATLDGSNGGYKYILTFNPQGLLDPNVWIFAFGQAFFSLSVAGNGSVIYGSYLSKKEALPSAARNVAIFDTCAALLAAFVILPAMAAGGVSCDSSGPGLMFIYLVNVLNGMVGGRIIGVIFFVCVLFAGASSIINLYEVSVAFLQEKFGLNRIMATIIMCAIGCAIAINIQAITSQWMDVVSIYICPLGAFLAGVMFFWVAGKEFAEREVSLGSNKKIGSWFFPLGKYVYCTAAVVALVAGALLGGIG